MPIRNEEDSKGDAGFNPYSSVCRSIVTYEGAKVELRCYASGYPLPDIYWRRQNNDVLPTNSSVFKARQNQ
jgi:hypothetical protein